MTSLYTDVTSIGGSGDDDADLVCAHFAGDPEAFERIVRRYTPLLLAVGRRRLGSAPDAEDAVQECFERAYKGIRNLRDPGLECRLRPWLLRILANVCTDFVARRGRQRAVWGRVAAHCQEPLWIDFEVRDPVAERDLDQALADLPTSQREAFLLREIGGLEYPAVAEITGATEDNARARVHRARRTLRLKLSSFQIGIAPVLAAVQGWRKGVLTFHRRSGDTAAHLLLTQSPEVAGSGTSSTAVAVFTVAASIASVGGGVVGAVLPHTSGRATVVATASSQAASGSPVPTYPSVATTHEPNPQVKVQASSPTHAAVVPPSTTTTVALPASTTVGPTTVTPAPADASPQNTGSSSSVDLSWVGPAESDGAPSGSQASDGSTGSSASQTPSSACSGLLSMPGPGLPTSAAASLAGLQVTQIVTAVEPAVETSGGFMIFSGGADLVSEVGGPPHTPVQIGADVCMTAPTQVMVADLTLPNQQAGMLQLRGALVATTSSVGETGGFFRGSVVPLSPVSGAFEGLPSGFVGEISCQTATSQCALTLAFVADQVPTSAPATSSGSGASSGSGTSTATDGSNGGSSTGSTSSGASSDPASGTGSSAPSAPPTKTRPTQGVGYAPPQQDPGLSYVLPTLTGQLAGRSSIAADPNSIASPASAPVPPAAA